MSPEIAESIYRLLQDPVVRPIVDNYSSNFYLMDNAS
jgi:hypothetical protein